MSLAAQGFLVDCIPEFCAWLNIDEEQIHPLLEWLAPPPNLQHFLTVVSNLAAVLQAGDDIPYAQPPASITSFLQLIEERQARHAEMRPRALDHLQPRSQGRPSGIIGEYPIYASLVGVVDYPKEHAGLYRALHAVALHCGIGYRQMAESGVIDDMSGALDEGMRDIRRLESTEKRPVNPPPHPSDCEELQDYGERLKNWIHEEREEGSIWGDGLVSLIAAYLNRRARSEGKSSAGIEIRQTIEILDEDEPVADGATSRERAGNRAFSVHRLKEMPSRHQQAALLDQGVHPDEAGGAEAIRFEGPAAHHPLNRVDHRQNLRHTAGLKNRIVRNAQHLPTEWATPTPFELWSLLSDLTKEASSANEAEASIAAWMQLILWTGCSVEDIAKLRFVASSAGLIGYGRSSLCYIAREQIFAMPTHSPLSGATRRLSEDQNRLHQVYGRTPWDRTGYYHARLPNKPMAAAEHLRKIHCPDSGQGKPIPDADTLRKDIEKRLTEHNARLKTRWTVKRLEQVMPHALLQTSGDVADVFVMTGQAYTHAEVSSHYYAPLNLRLTQKFQTAIEWLMRRMHDSPQPVPPPPPPSSLRVGSPHLPSEALVFDISEHLVHNLRAQRRQKSCQETWIRTHNALVTYIAHWLGFATAYRAVGDPLASLREIAREERMIVVSDKDDQNHYHARILPIPAALVEQIDAYIEHLHTLRNRFLQHKKLANQISLLLRQDSVLTDIPTETDIGLLFLVRDDLDIQAVTPRSLGGQVPWNLVANFNRHYLRTTLRERGCPAVYVDYFYGHWTHGEEPFQPHSMVSPLEMAQVLVPHLDAINTNLGWRVVEGLIGG